LIELKNILAQRADFCLSIKSLNLKPGDFVAVLGNNGSGKSTFLSLLSGFLTFKGNYRVKDRDFESYSLKERNSTVGLLPQKTALNMPFDVFYVILTGRFPLTNGFHYRQEDHRATGRVIAKFDIEHLAKRSFNELSGGEKQRVLLARALNRETPVSLLDEPLTGIDLRHQHETINFLKKQQKDKIFLVVMHDVSLAIREFDRFLIFSGGDLVYDVTKDQISAQKLAEVFEVEIDFLTHKDKLVVYSAIDDKNTDQT